MTTQAEKQDRGLLRVDAEECKGCGLCVEACPADAITLSERINRLGYRTAAYKGARCSACGICFLVCPEPGAIKILRVLNGPLPTGENFDFPDQGVSPCASN